MTMFRKRSTTKGSLTMESSARHCCVMSNVEKQVAGIQDFNLVSNKNWPRYEEIVKLVWIKESKAMKCTRVKCK